jgi:hypothetical protein
MSEDQAPYHTSTTPTTIAQAAHDCRERVLRANGELNRLLAGVRTGEIDARAAQERCRRLSRELRAAADALERSSAD